MYLSQWIPKTFARYTRYKIPLFKLSACFRLSLYQIRHFIVQTICMFSSIVIPDTKFHCSNYLQVFVYRYTRYELSLFKLSACFRLSLYQIRNFIVQTIWMFRISLYQIRNFIVQTICMFSSIVIPDTRFHCSNYLHDFVYRYTRYEISLFKLSACFRLLDEDHVSSVSPSYGMERTNAPKDHGLQGCF